MSKQDRRRFIRDAGASLILGATLLAGCRGTSARIMNPWEESGTGSDKAGGEVYTPIVAATTDKLLARAQELPLRQVAYNAPDGYQRYKICFVGLENLSSEEMGDFKEHINATINQRIVESQQFEVLHDRAVAAGLHKIGCRSDDLFLPANRRLLSIGELFFILLLHDFQVVQHFCRWNCSCRRFIFIKKLAPIVIPVGMEAAFSAMGFPIDNPAVCGAVSHFVGNIGSSKEFLKSGGQQMVPFDSLLVYREGYVCGKTGMNSMIPFD